MPVRIRGRPRHVRAVGYTYLGECVCDSMSKDVIVASAGTEGVA